MRNRLNFWSLHNKVDPAEKQYTVRVVISNTKVVDGNGDAVFNRHINLLFAREGITVPDIGIPACIYAFPNG